MKVEARADFVSQAGEVWCCVPWETWVVGEEGRCLAITKCKASSRLLYSIPSVLGGRLYYDYPVFIEEETEAQRG